MVCSEHTHRKSRKLFLKYVFSHSRSRYVNATAHNAWYKGCSLSNTMIERSMTSFSNTFTVSFIKLSQPLLCAFDVVIYYNFVGHGKLIDLIALPLVRKLNSLSRISVPKTLSFHPKTELNYFDQIPSKSFCI